MGDFYRLVLVVTLAVTGCTHAAAIGPAWPKSASSGEDDGGESLAPHESRQMSVAIEKSEDEVRPAPVVVAPTPIVSAPAAAAPVIAPSMSLPIEETITSEDIIIEIDD